jgi:hypothetical protein
VVVLCNIAGASFGVTKAVTPMMWRVDEDHRRQPLTACSGCPGLLCL